METKIFVLRGTRPELESFLRSLDYSPQFTARVASTQDDVRDFEEDDVHGQVDLTEMVVHFGLALGAHATWDLLRGLFEEFRRGRRHLTMKEPPAADRAHSDHDSDVGNSAVSDPESATGENLDEGQKPDADSGPAETGD